MLRINHLTKKFGETLAVNDVTFKVAPAERVGLLGPNGAGKSTTILMSLGVTTPDSGSVVINGKDVQRNRAQALQDVGFAAAYMSTPHTIKVIEALRVAAGTAGLSLRSENIDEVVERFGIRKFLARKGGELSSGQKTLVGLARACVSKPALLILDEPTAYLDPSMSLEVRRRVEAVCDEWGSSLLITSHNMRDIDHLCDRVVFLRRGSILYDMSPDGLRATVGTDDLDEAFVDIATSDTPPEAPPVKQSQMQD